MTYFIVGRWVIRICFGNFIVVEILAVLPLDIFLPQLCNYRLGQSTNQAWNFSSPCRAWHWPWPDSPPCVLKLLGQFRPPVFLIQLTTVDISVTQPFTEKQDNPNTFCLFDISINVIFLITYYTTVSKMLLYTKTSMHSGTLILWTSTWLVIHTISNLVTHWVWGLRDIVVARVIKC